MTNTTRVRTATRYTVAVAIAISFGGLAGCGGSAAVPEEGASAAAADLIQLGAEVDTIWKAFAFDAAHIDASRVLIGGPEQAVVLDTRTGRLNVVEGSDGFTGPRRPVLANDGSIYAVDFASGVLERLVPGGTEVVEIARFEPKTTMAVDAVGGQLFVFLSDSQELVALDADGVEQWRHTFERPTLAVDVESLADGVIVVGSREEASPVDGTTTGPRASALIGLNAESGEPTFERRIDGEISRITLRGDVLIVSIAFEESSRTQGIPVIEVSETSPSLVFDVVGTRVVFDSTGVPFADEQDDISQLDPDSFEVETTIRSHGQILIAAGPDALYSVDFLSDDIEVQVVATPRPLGE